MLMVERNNAKIAALIRDWLRERGLESQPIDRASAGTI
jgi:hypothetical protein